MTRNHTILGLLAVATLCGAPAVGAQEGPPKAQQKQATEAEIQALIEKLGAEKNADRREAQRSLAEIGDAARGALEDAVEHSDDPEVRWRARRVLRELDGAQPRLERRQDRADVEPQGQGRGRDRQDPGVRDEVLHDQDLHDQIQRMVERMERAFGEDFGQLRGLEDLQRQMEDMRRQFEQMRPGQGFEVRGIPPGVAGQGMQIQIGPDGVKVQVEEDGEAKTYEAESMEAFREKYPEVAKRYFGDGQGFGFRPFGFRTFKDTDGDGLPDALAPETEAIPPEFRPFAKLNPDYFDSNPVEVVPAPQAPPAEGERLGIYVGDLAPAVREFLEIPVGQGLLVESIEPGSLAAELGIRPKDIVLSIGDRAVAGPADVRAALREIPKSETVAVKVNRRGEVLDLEATKQHDAPADAGKLRKRPAEAGESGERR